MPRQLNSAFFGNMKSIGTFFCLFSFCILLIVSTAAAAQRYDLILKEAIEIALRKNLLVKQEEANRAIAGADILIREGEFDPALKLQVNESFKKGPVASEIMGSEERLFQSEIGLGGKIHTGATYELKWTNASTRNNSPFFTLNPYYSSELTLTISQPFLKGAGSDVQKSGLRVARNNLSMASLSLDERAEQIVADTSMSYWILVSARAELEVAEISLRLARDLLEEVKAKITAGTLAPAEIYKAEAEVALREEALLRNRKLIADAEDKLRIVMNIENWNAEIVPADRPPATSEMPPLDQALKTALANRKDLLQSAIDSQNKEILRRFYENQMLPDISITGSAGLNGLDGHYSDALDRIGAGRSYSWQVGIFLGIPIGNRSAKGNMLRAKYEEDRAGISREIIRQKVVTEVREAWRALQLAMESVEATAKTRTAAEKRLDAESVRFRTGMATLTDVLKFQEEYARAVSSERESHLQYAKAVTALEKSKGTLWHRGM
ncbi:MAG: TolC family protein [Nitrospirae bacterium]|nr:TolC family protein [Nitrospirota bacterium]